VLDDTAVTAGARGDPDPAPVVLRNDRVTLAPRHGAHELEIRDATYMDVHDIPGVKAADVAGAHEADVRVQDQYGVNYRHYWVDEEEARCSASSTPDRETAARVHQEAHGLEAHTLRGRAGA
jgi:hypothetical protein